MRASRSPQLQYIFSVWSFVLAPLSLDDPPVWSPSWDFVMGALSYTLAGTDALKLIVAINPRDAGNDEALLRRLAPFLIAGLKAPLPRGDALDGED